MKIKGSEKESVFFFVNGKTLNSLGSKLVGMINLNYLDKSLDMIYIAEKNKNDDFLYITYSEFEAFGK